MAAACGRTLLEEPVVTGTTNRSATGVVWRVLTLAQWREQPLRVLVTIAVIALGVALSSAVYLINAGALGEFNQATRRLTGEADLILRGPKAGFDESLFADIARRPGVRTASAVLELDVPVVGQKQPLKILGLDPLRAGSIQPQLLGDIAGNLLELFDADTVILSASAAQQLGVKPGDRIEVTVGETPQSLRVLGRTDRRQLSAAHRRDGYRERAVEARPAWPDQSHRSAPRAGDGCRGIPCSTRSAAAARRARHRTAARA
jgi:hypothetical protein